MAAAAETPLDPGALAERSAVVIPIVSAEAVVSQHRQALDPSAARGVPAHVTVLYPFMSSSRLNTSVLTEVGAAVRSIGPFECVFARTRWFGDDVLWLAPEPSEPFRQLTEAVRAAFPACLPYGGAHLEPVPHLTIAGPGCKSVGELRAAELAVTAQLPIAARVDKALLMRGTQAPNSWRVIQEFDL